MRDKKLTPMCDKPKQDARDILRNQNTVAGIRAQARAAVAPPIPPVKLCPICERRECSCAPVVVSDPDFDMWDIEYGLSQTQKQALHIGMIVLSVYGEALREDTEINGGDMVDTVSRAYLDLQPARPNAEYGDKP